jgi:hypothetical protein
MNKYKNIRPEIQAEILKLRKRGPLQLNKPPHEQEPVNMGLFEEVARLEGVESC